MRQSDVIWRQGSGSTLAQVMACCLTAPSHYLNQCWLLISEVLWHSPDSNFTENTSDIYLWNEFEIYWFETVVKYPRGQWVNSIFCVSLQLLVLPSLVGLLWMLYLAANETQFHSALIYGTATFFLFVVSTTFHTISYTGQSGYVITHFISVFLVPGTHISKGLWCYVFMSSLEILQC